MLERIQSDLKQGDLGVRQLAVSEEMLELLGSLAFGLALLSVALEVGTLVARGATRTQERPFGATTAARAGLRPEARVASGGR